MKCADSGRKMIVIARRAATTQSRATGNWEAGMAETRIAVIGCAGRVGRMLVADIVAAEGCALAGGVARPGSAAFGQDLGHLAGIGHLGIAVGDDAERLLSDSDVAIEFSTAAATAEHAASAARLGK